MLSGLYENLTSQQEIPTGLSALGMTEVFGGEAEPGMFRPIRLREGQDPPLRGKGSFILHSALSTFNCPEGIAAAPQISPSHFARTGAK